MGYDVHITRKEFWSDDAGPEISREEWQQYVAGCSDLTLDPDNHDYAIWDGESKHELPWLGWHEGEIYTKNPDRALVVKMMEIARDLNARVVGDDGEEYRSEADLPPDDTEVDPSEPLPVDNLKVNSSIESGLYRVNYRGWSLPECFRIGNLLGFPIAVLFKLFGKKGPHQWLPIDETEYPCQQSHLSQNALDRILPEISKLNDLGYTQGMFFAPTKQFNPSFKDGGSYAALHEDGVRCMTLDYIHIIARALFTSKNVQFLAISGLTILDDNTLIEVKNTNYYFDTGKTAKVAVVLKGDVKRIQDRLDTELNDVIHRTRKFNNLDEFRSAHYSIVDKIYREQIARGVYFKLSHEKLQKIFTAVP